MKKCLIFALILLCLTGCSGISELENRDFVLGLGLEYDNNEYTAYASIAQLTVSGEDTGAKTNLKSAVGKTPQQAFESLDRVTSGRLFYGQAVAMLVDNAEAEAIDYCASNLEIGKSIIMLKSNDISMVYNSKYGDSTAIDFIEDYYGNNIKNVKKVTLNELLIARSENKNIELPEITVENDEPKIISKRGV